MIPPRKASASTKKDRKANSHSGKGDNSSSKEQSEASLMEGGEVGKASSHADYGGSALQSVQSMNTQATTKTEGPSYSELKAEFLEEMRYLSKLRHPCITMIMGAVNGNGPTKEPLLVMEYMVHGSLHDVLHNETAAVEADLLLPILRDISQGILFLHSANPQCIHCDLKSQNILLDRYVRMCRNNAECFSVSNTSICSFSRTF